VRSQSHWHYKRDGTCSKETEIFINCSFPPTFTFKVCAHNNNRCLIDGYSLEQKMAFVFFYFSSIFFGEIRTENDTRNFIQSLDPPANGVSVDWLDFGIPHPRKKTFILLETLNSEQVDIVFLSRILQFKHTGKET
jgi:hypothetical protein